VVLTREVGVIHDAQGAVVNRDVLKSGASSFLVDKANYRHFMAKEIHEQPEVVSHTLARYVDMATERVALPKPHGTRPGTAIGKHHKIHSGIVRYVELPS
jgi:glutamine---fructose-6-phosphate transaminase (isomerizing)